MDLDTLMTARLSLHPLTIAEATVVEAGDPRDPPHGARWAPGYPDDGDRARRFLAACASAGGSTQPFGPYEIRRRTDGMAIGGAAFHGGPDVAGQVTVGYGLISSARGRGYASEALRALLAFARSQGFSPRRVTPIWATSGPTASWRRPACGWWRWTTG